MAMNPQDLFQQPYSNAQLTAALSAPGDAHLPSPTPAQVATAPPVSAVPPPAQPGTLPSDPVQAVTRAVQPMETVQGQLNELFDQGNPLMVQAREGAQRMAAGRGLQNSTMAAQAGEQALFSSAMPIASQDAQAHLQTAMTNQNAENTFGLTDRQGQIQSGLSAQDYQQQAGLQQQGGQIQAGLSNQAYQQEGGLSHQNFEQQGSLSHQSFQQQAALNTEEFQHQMEQAKQKFGFDTSLSAQDAYQRLQELAAQGDQQARLALLGFEFETSLTNLRGQIALNQSNNDFANDLIKLATQGDIQSQLQLEQFGFNTQLSAQDNLQRLAQLAAQGDINAQLQLQQFQYQSLLNDQQNGFALTLEDQRFQQNQNLLIMEYAQRIGLTGVEAQYAMEQLNQQHANTLEEIALRVEAASGADAAAAGRALQSNYLLTVADRQRVASGEIAQIYQTEGLTAAQQNAAVQNAYDRMNQDLAVISAYYQSSPLWDTNYGGGGGTTAPTSPTPTSPTSPTSPTNPYPTNPYPISPTPPSQPHEWGNWDYNEPSNNPGGWAHPDYYLHQP